MLIRPDLTSINHRTSWAMTILIGSLIVGAPSAWAQQPEKLDASRCATRPPNSKDCLKVDDNDNANGGGAGGGIATPVPSDRKGQNKNTGQKRD